VPLAPPTPDTSLLRFRLVYDNQALPISPLAGSDLLLSREPGEQSAAGAFYYRDKLSGGPLTFTGEDFALLYAIERSTDRCQVLGLLVQHRGNPSLPWETWRGSFTCSDCEAWNAATCSVQLSPQAADAYQKLLDNYEKEYNILLTPGARRTVTAELVTLASGVSLEFRPVSLAEESDYVGTDGWTLFLTDRSWIPGGLTGGLRNDIDILFRYRLRGVAMTPNGQGGWIPIDKRATGWQVLLETFNPTAGTVDYVKPPAIAGFKPYKIGTYSNWNDPRNPGAAPSYGAALLLVDASKAPADYGYQNADYVELTGAGGFNSPPDECPGGLSRRVRRYVSDEQCSRLFWRFGTFQFGRCFPFLDGLYNILTQTVAAFGGQALLPPTPAQLSQFLSAPVNQATGELGATNELPGLLLSAGSDVKRYGSSEAATRLLISLKQLLADMQWWDGGWFIDPTTGWLRYEHRAWLEQQTAPVVDLTRLEDALLSNAYAYRTRQLPRYEELAIANASTEDVKAEVYFAKASLDYGLSACVNKAEGSNRVSTSISRLTGDVAAGVLNGDSIPDNALFVLAPDAAGHLSQANRQLSASGLLARYWRRGRAAATATIEGPAPAQLPNSVTGSLPVSGIPAQIDSVRPNRVQAGISGRLCSLRTLAPEASYQTNLGAGGQLAKAELSLRTRLVKLTIWLPALAPLGPPPRRPRQFDGSFDNSFH